MAALLDTDTLRRHALPTALLLEFERAAGLASASAPAAPRARLVASWRVGPDGRPTCRWTVAEPPIRGLPPN
jgi:hypothetical protein